MLKLTAIAVNRKCDTKAIVLFKNNKYIYKKKSPMSAPPLFQIEVSHFSHKDNNYKYPTYGISHNFYLNNKMLKFL